MLRPGTRGRSWLTIVNYFQINFKLTKGAILTLISGLYNGPTEVNIPK
jgi:hypothetical protein